MFLEKVQRVQIGLFDGLKKLMVRRNELWNSFVEEVTWRAQLPKIDFSSAADFVERSLAAECFLYLIKNMIKDGTKIRVGGSSSEAGVLRVQGI